MVYSLAMASLDGSKFPPMSRGLNNREREQLRISKIQQREFRSNSVLVDEAEAIEEDEQHRNKSNAQQRKEDRESLFQTIGKDEEIHNSMAYSLAMAMDPEELDFMPLTRSLRSNRRKERLSTSSDQIRNDRATATEQLYGDYDIDHDTGDSNGIDIDLDDDDILSVNYTRSFSTLENEVPAHFPPLTRPLKQHESDQLRISKEQLISKKTYPEQHRRQHSLPLTLEDALLPSSEAIVITEAKMPFRVFNVNAAWEGLCGYSYVESKGKSLGSLLSGEETDACAVTALIHQLFVHGEEATTVLTNYTKDGRKFRNRLRVGPLYDKETNEVSHFVGVLKEVSVAA